MLNCSTLTLLDELPTDGHHPMKFLCDDGNLYYCKYRINAKLEELDFLIYELACHALLRALAIPTPDIAFVKVSPGSFDPKMLQYNKRYLKPGVVCFGSQHIEGDLVRDTEAYYSPRQFSFLYNPADLIRIAVFDLWVDNIDRGRRIEGGYNYNLLTTPLEGQRQFVAFDNAFAFGGESMLRIFTPLSPIDLKNRLWSTPYYKAVVKHISVSERFTIAKECLTLCYEQAERVLTDIWEQIPVDWNPRLPLRDKLVSFLLNEPRKQQLGSLITIYNAF